jgi:outer membrane lipoprotein-sorting protein
MTLPKPLERLSPIFAAALGYVLLAAALASCSRAQSADELVAKVLAARGGPEKLRAIQSQRVSGKISFGPSAEGPFMVQFERPLKMHMEITVGGQTLVRVYDGKSAGWIINPFAPDKGVHPMDDVDLRTITDEADFDGPLLDYPSKGNKVEFAGKDEVDGKPVVKLKLTSKTGDVRTYIFDASTYLLVKWEGQRPIENQQVPIETVFSDYRDVHGVKFAFEIDSSSPGSNAQQKITIEKIEINPQLDPALFAKPPSPPSASIAKPSAAAAPAR